VAGARLSLASIKFDKKSIAKTIVRNLVSKIRAVFASVKEALSFEPAFAIA